MLRSHFTPYIFLWTFVTHTAASDLMMDILYVFV